MSANEVGRFVSVFSADDVYFRIMKSGPLRSKERGCRSGANMAFDSVAEREKLMGCGAGGGGGGCFAPRRIECGSGERIIKGLLEIYN